MVEALDLLVVPPRDQNHPASITELIVIYSCTVDCSISITVEQQVF